MKKKIYRSIEFLGNADEFQYLPRTRVGATESKDTTPEEFRAARVNEAFNGLAREINRFLEICFCMESPVKSVHIQGSPQGKHVRTNVRYHRPKP